MHALEIATRPYDDQRPGTAGLRRRVATFRQPNYLENFLQSVFDVAGLPADATLVVGGDGRFHNDAAIATLLAMAPANGVRRVIVGRDGLLSTPAASHLIRCRRADGGFLLTASHNPGGPQGDFGIKFNVASGGQAPEAMTEAIYRRTLELTHYRTLAEPPRVDLSRTGVSELDGCTVEVVDPVDDYAALMQRLFDFDRIGAMLANGRFRLRFDAMHAVTGPYAERILVGQLGAPPDSVMNTRPLADFGGLHPDPNPVDAADLVALTRRDDAPDLAAASDGDGDRNMILGRGCLVHPCDSLAILAAQHAHVPGYRGGLAGIARSMPTSRAADRVAQALGIPCHVTPTGWRFFCNLLEDGRITLCGEESFGTSSDHTREKDGLWAVLYWLNLLAATGRSVAEELHEHWRRFGRDYYRRHDYLIKDTDAANALVSELRERCESGDWDDRPERVTSARDFAYDDPVDGSRSEHQGIELTLGDGSRIVYRLSGTGTSGATLRVYLERHAQGDGLIDLDPGEALQGLADAAHALARITQHTGLEEPTHRI